MDTDVFTSAKFAPTPVDLELKLDVRKFDGTTTEHEFSDEELDEAAIKVYRAATDNPGAGYKLGANSPHTRDMLRRLILTVLADEPYSVQTLDEDNIWQVRLANGSIIRVQNDWR